MRFFFRQFHPFCREFDLNYSFPFCVERRYLTKENLFSAMQTRLVTITWIFHEIFILFIFSQILHSCVLALSTFSLWFNLNWGLVFLSLYRISSDSQKGWSISHKKVLNFKFIFLGIGIFITKFNQFFVFWLFVGLVLRIFFFKTKLLENWKKHPAFRL